MLVKQAVQLTALAAVLWWEQGEAATSAFKVCGRKLGEIMSRVCHVYNSPAWDVPTVVEQPAAAVRRRRDTGGIADECCTYGCTWEQLSEYCSVSANSDSVLEETHLIADRSVEQEAASRGEVSAPARAPARAPAMLTEGAESAGAGAEAGAGEVGGERAGYASRRGRRRCRCRKRPRREGRRRQYLMGNMGALRNVARAAPLVGTVSPLLTWGRTINTDLPLPQLDRDRYAYVAVYST